MSDSTAQHRDDSTPVKTRKTPRIGRSFSSRNPLPIGAIGLVFLLVLLYGAFNAASLPLIGGGTTYSAYFTESANLKTGDNVRIAGIKVGNVEDVTIDTARNLVKATFTVKDGFVGDESKVDIKLKTLLGAKYLSINSMGAGKQDAGKTIPVSRTTTPLDIYPAFTKLTHDDPRHQHHRPEQGLHHIGRGLLRHPEQRAAGVTGLARLSTTIASRDGALRTLLSRANQVTGTLAARDQDLTRLISDGNLLLQELNARRDAIHSLLINTQVLSTQLRGLVADNQKTIGPLLTSLDKILTLLKNNEDSLDRGVSLLGPLYRVFNNAVGNGRWFDNYIQNLSPCGIFAIALKIESC